MGKRLDSMLFPGGRGKAVTMSYDDGVTQDRRLTEIFNKYGVKCTFNLGSGVLGFRGSVRMKDRQVDISKLDPEEVPGVYAGHEIAAHGLFHSALQSVGTPLAMYELIEDRRRLEEITGRPVRSFAYPFGTHNENVRELLALAGFTAARTVRSTYRFDLPRELLAWDPTCHHGDPRLMELTESFLDARPRMGPMLLYVWGHAYEFDADDNWDVPERLCQTLARGGDQIWFATNGQISDYMAAYRRLLYSADGTMVTNPSALEVWLQVSGRPYRIPAGETVRVEDPGL